MDYEDFLSEIMNLDFINDPDEADSAIKAVLGILASRMEESQAARMAGELPEPLTLDKLRGHQKRATTISVEEYIAEIADLFALDYDQAYTLVNTVLSVTKESLEGETLEDIEINLPPDWARTIENA
ncbi:MAG: DUF2267 domain-containing protein [Syntrophales bacterium]